MEKDPNIERIIREAGVISAPDHFTESVMDRIEAEPDKKVYKPLIGKTGRIIIILAILLLVLVTLFYSQSGSGSSPSQWSLPAYHLNLDFIRDIKIPASLVATLLAIFVLVLSDANMKRKREGSREIKPG